MPLRESDCPVSYKVLILGDASVGKTAILRSLIGKEFLDKTRPTVALDFVKKAFEVDGAFVQLNIWDTAGQERFHSMTRQQFRDVQGIVLVYDITDKSTFSHLSFWMDNIENDVSHRNSKYETIPLVVIGNKTDLDETRQVKDKEGQKLAEKEMAFGFFETSAKMGTNIYTAFQKLAYHITEVCDPHLMKSFHPYMLRPPEVLQKTGSTMQQINPLYCMQGKKNKISSKKKQKNSEKKKSQRMSTTDSQKCDIRFKNDIPLETENITENKHWFRQSVKDENVSQTKSVKRRSVFKLKRKKTTDKSGTVNAEQIEMKLFCRTSWNKGGHAQTDHRKSDLKACCVVS